MSYERIRAALCEQYGWTFAVVDEMSLEQIESACAGGKQSRGMPVNSVEDVKRLARNWRRVMGI